MAWFKVDDKLHDHRKARAAGTAAMGVWLLAGSWAADNLTDGFIPATILPRWGRPRDAKRLVEVGLWHADEQDGETGWRFHEWEERQPTRAQKLEERAAKAEAGKRGGLASGRSRRQANTKQSASGQVELPTRPDPTNNTPRAGRSVSDDDPTFAAFWEAYPRKTAKGGARKAWASMLKKHDGEPAEIVEAARRFAGRVKGSEEKFIPHPATWLNQERWLDEDTQQPTAGPGGNPWDVFVLPDCPPEIADDPGAYQQWVRDRRADWDAKRAGGDR